MKFVKGGLVGEGKERGQVCVLGALALSQGITKRYLRDSDDRAVAIRLSKKLKLPTRTLLGLVSLNESAHWSRLERRLRQLELLHLVRKFALPLTQRATKTAVTA